MTDAWIVIPNWKRFQHYGKRDPIWIKVYTALASNPDWDGLTLPQRGLLLTVWLMYAQSRGNVSAKQVAKEVGRSYKARSLEALVHAGFIELSASRPLSLRYQNASAELEVEKSKNPLTPTEWGTNSTNDKPKTSRAAGTNPRAIAKTVEKIDKEAAHHESLTQATHLATTWNGTDSAQFDHELDQLEQLLQSRLSFGERDDLWEKAFHRG